jgi:hypothetical protein
MSEVPGLETKAVIESVMALDRAPDVRSLMELLR